MVEKNSKDVATEMLIASRTNLLAMEIKERYFSQQSILAKSREYEMMLGKTQAEIRETRKLISFLDNYIKELG